LGVTVEGAGLVAEGAVVAGAGECASPGERAEVEPHPTRPIKPATAASLAYRRNADKALTSNQRATFLGLCDVGRGQGPTTRFPRLWSQPAACPSAGHVAGGERAEWCGSLTTADPGSASSPPGPR